MTITTDEAARDVVRAPRSWDDDLARSDPALLAEARLRIRTSRGTASNAIFFGGQLRRAGSSTRRKHPMHGRGADCAGARTSTWTLGGGRRRHRGTFLTRSAPRYGATIIRPLAPRPRGARWTSTWEDPDGNIVSFGGTAGDAALSVRAVLRVSARVRAHSRTPCLLARTVSPRGRRSRRRRRGGLTMKFPHDERRSPMLSAREYLRRGGSSTDDALGHVARRRCGMFPPSRPRRPRAAMLAVVAVWPRWDHSFRPVPPRR
jgi:hypothetical protein